LPFGLRGHSAGVALALLAAFGFSLKAIFVKLAYPYGVDAVTLLALRMAFSLPAFLWAGMAAMRASPEPLSGGDWGRLLALGLAGYYGASILDFLGLQYITAGLERLILFTYPTLTLLLGVLFHGRQWSRREIGATLLCYVGIAFAFAHDLRLGEASTVWLGGLLVLGSSMAYAVYLAGSGPMIQRLGAMRFTALALLVSTAASLLHFSVSHPFQALVQPLPVYLCAAGMALLSTVFPVFAQSAAIRVIGPGRAALVGMVGPLLTIAFGWALLGESFSLPQGVGAALVLSGVALVSRR
jgi:drug/metabolite transporter (DMT)-like permease